MPALNLLSQYCDLEINPDDRFLDRETLLKKVKGRDGVLCLLTDTIDAPVFDAAKGAVIFAKYAVGFNNIDIQAATERGVLIINTPGVLTESTAEMVWALLFATARRVVESDRYNREGKFKGWGPLHFLGQGITGKTLGIIGSGRICPHIASATEETRTKMGIMAAENLLAGFRGEIPPNCLNPEVIKG